MKIEYDVEKPRYIKNSRKRSEEYFKIIDLINGTHSSMKIIYESDKKANLRRASIEVTRKRENLPIKLMVRKNELFVFKLDDIAKINIGVTGGAIEAKTSTREEESQSNRERSQH